MSYIEQYPHLKFKKHWTITGDTYYQLGECSALIRSISLLPLQPSYRQHLLGVSLEKGARATTAIEGNTLTEREIEKIKKGESLPPSKEYQEIEVKNILDALNLLLNEVVSEDKIQYISPDLIKRFHFMVGKNLGKHFDAIPGQFRTDQRIVGLYRTPDYKYVDDLVFKLCEWIKEEFNFGKKQSFIDSVIQAIVTHIYIEWIHPFGDGNGRTGRLIEFYILLRAGNPSIASHILSNFYNDTRSEYYRQIDNAIKTKDLTEFIEYAVQGYRDGLLNTLEVIQSNFFEVTWQKFIYDSFAEKKYTHKSVYRRQRGLILQMPFGNEYDIDEITLINPMIARDYASLSKRTVLRDLKELEEMNLLKKNKSKYSANIEILRQFIPK